MVQAVDKIWNIQGMIQGMIQALVQDLQAEAYGTSCTGIFTGFIKVSDFWLEHQGDKRVAQGMMNGWARDRVVIDTGSVGVHKALELPGFHQGTYPRRLNCQVFTIGRFVSLYYFFVFLCFSKAGYTKDLQA